jgi:(4-(4-[2-(gamma-L-glutamylamino)ethyl]phenoxymethyl)furan-2-yl)methanamine synthase
MTWLALDIGGANLKAAHRRAEARARSFALWRDPKGLPRELAGLASEFPAFDRIALTMTAELCDCYPTKSQGVCSVLDCVLEAFPGRDLVVWGVDGRFHDVTEIRASPLLAAASNWLALATACARMSPAGAGLLVDIGSTTTDIISFADGKVTAIGRTDTDRMRSGALVYLGVRRTPLCAIASALPFRGAQVGLAAELFATTLDVFLTLGDIRDDPNDNGTADGRPATRPDARDRLARMICADRDTFDDDDAHHFALAAREAILVRLREAAGRVVRSALPLEAILVSGSGEFLARELAGSLASADKIVSVSKFWGRSESVAACARALLELACDESLFPRKSAS